MYATNQKSEHLTFYCHHHYHNHHHQHYHLLLSRKLAYMAVMFLNQHSGPVSLYLSIPKSPNAMKHSINTPLPERILTSSTFYIILETLIAFTFWNDYQIQFSFYILVCRLHIIKSLTH